MKKIIFSVLLSLSFALIGAKSVKADTINLSEIVERVQYNTGDVIFNDTNETYEFSYSNTSTGHIEGKTLESNETFTLPCNLLFGKLTNNDKLYSGVQFMLGTKDEKRYITVTEGEQICVNLRELFDYRYTSDFTLSEIDLFYFKNNKIESDKTITIDGNSEVLTIENVPMSMNGSKYDIDFRFTNGVGYPTGEIHINVNKKENSANVNSDSTNEEKEEKPHKEPTKTPEQIESERKNKDTLPSGTIQGIGGKKDFNFKALNPVQRDVNNQQIFADYYAKQLGFKSELLISKDIYAPYGHTKESKWQSRTISWKNTGAKFGDLIYVVWYCQEAHEMQFIQANVLPDGTVVFTIPKSGDVSTISIVKLNK